MQFSFVIGGAAGQGINTVEQQLISYLTQSGFFFHSCKDYMSRVRGGVNFTQITLANHDIQSDPEQLDLLFSLTQEVLDTVSTRLKPEGLLICDTGHQIPAHYNGKVMPLHFSKILTDTENPKGASMLALGAVTKALGFSKEQLEAMMNPKWPQAFRDKNLQTAVLAFSETSAYFELEPGSTKQQIALSGNHAVALGALAAGISFYAAYPMAPSTSVMSYVSRYEKQMEVLVEQVEDEIAAINAVIGASATGVRAMTATSGGGFSLMAEGLGLAAVAEVPLVVLDVQRPGPATGMATRTEQSDLNFVLNASQGEFPRIIMSYRNISDCFYQTFKAFNLADKYRVPVILLSDQYLADSAGLIPNIDLNRLQINRYLHTEISDDYLHHDPEELVQLRACPGLSQQIVMNDSHEHDPEGHVTESAENRIHMNHRRMEKLSLIASDLEEPDYFGAETPKQLMLVWGSVTEAAKAAVTLLNEQGHDLGLLAFGDLYPLPQQQLFKWHSAKVPMFTVEGNYQGQLAQLIARETGIWIENSILKFDGRPFTPEYIAEAYKEMI